jgi:hypothetical protein
LSIVAAVVFVFGLNWGGIQIRKTVGSVTAGSGAAVAVCDPGVGSDVTVNVETGVGVGVYRTLLIQFESND